MTPMSYPCADTRCRNYTRTPFTLCPECQRKADAARQEDEKRERTEQWARHHGKDGKK